jgi:dihydrofolate synthase / folylpolyglutamate synthase
MNTDLAYQQALDYLYSFIDYSLQRNFRMAPEQFDLGRMRVLMAALGDPQLAYPTIHIAGTKGKGSVSAMCRSALQAAGYRTGMYTSPHLQEYTERIQIDGIEIPKADLVELVNEVKPFVAEIPRLTTFEITTALAFWHFARQRVDAAVIEVGLGGRLDATNILTPRVSVITSLSYDHSEILGDTLAKIAVEKAGIIKPGVPIVLSPQKEEARRVVEQIARERGAPFIQVGRDYLFAPLAHSLTGQSLAIWHASEQQQVDAFIESGGLQEWEPARLNIPMLGYHQVENAATAYVALLALRESGMQILYQDLRKGFASVSWPGRFEIIRSNPPVVVDAAHNRDSALKLRLALDDYFPGQPVVLVFGASSDKDLEGMFAELMPRVSQVIATASIHPRAADPASLVTLAHQYGKPAQAVLPLEGAIDTALAAAGNVAVVLITGSIFVAGGALQIWQERNPLTAQG